MTMIKSRDNWWRGSGEREERSFNVVLFNYFDLTPPLLPTLILNSSPLLSVDFREFQRNAFS